MSSRRQVRNRLLGLTRNIIPYVRELRAVAGSISGAVVMQQLDYWFIRYPEGFYKFLEPTSNAPLYRPGQSWCEELGFTKDEFRTAFDKIGYRWASKSRFEIAPDKFFGKFYASYVDRRTNLTWYIRNHELVDLTLDLLLESGNFDSQEMGNPDLQQIDNPDLQGIGKPDSGGLENPISGNQQSRFREIGNPDILYTETTTEITEITSELLQGDSHPEEPIGSRHFHFPANFNDKEQNGILRVLSGLDTETAQNVIDEVAGIRLKGQIRQSPVSLAAELAKRAREGLFNPALALVVAERREREQRLMAERRETTSTTPASAKAGKKAIREMRGILKTASGKPLEKTNRKDS